MFSLNARLFAAAMATGSGFWFFQTQNARDYTLSLLIGVGILALSLRVLEARSQPGAQKPAALWAMIGLMATAPFVHFYLMYECLAVLIILGLFCPQWRLLLAAVLAALVATSEAYVHLVIARHTMYSLTNNWIQSNASWFLDNLRAAQQGAVNKFGLLALALCGLAAVYAHLRHPPGRNTANKPHRTTVSPADAPLLRRGLFPGDPVLILTAGVPILVLAGGIASSILITPNLLDRNLLVASPFLWGLYAWLYDAGPGRWRAWPRLAINLALAALVLTMATLVTQRMLPRTEAFRAGAALVESFPACRGADIPVFSVERTAPDHLAFQDQTVKIAYDRYLAGFATSRVVNVEPGIPQPLPADLRADIQRRIDGAGCPVIGWASHDPDLQHLNGLPAKMLTLADRPGASSRVAAKTFQYYGYGAHHRLKPPETIVIFMNRDQTP